MPRILGLDIGSNSIGWALIAEDRLIDMGVRVFPEGVDRDKQGGEVSKNETRRTARGMRRQIARRARRKAAMRRAVVEAGLYPADPDSQCLLDLLDPYALRSAALERKLEPHELGRILIHMAQRRGFLSNRKTDRSKKKENSEILKSISALAAEMGERTLGQHFAKVRKADRHRAVRGRHTRREMYEEEFRAVWEFQRSHHPDLLTDELLYGRAGQRKYPLKPGPLPKRKRNTLLAEYGLHGILFFQRALYWPKSIVGRCELEPKLKRCERADRHAQRFRILLDLNNLRLTGNDGKERPLTADERSKALRLLEGKKEVTFEDLRKKLGLEEKTGFNLQRGERKTLPGMNTDALLAGKNYFGKKVWDAKTEAEKDAIVQALIDDEEDTLKHKAVNDWGCSSELAERLVDAPLDEGYMAFSRFAIDKLLPHLERGLKYMGRDKSDSALHAAGYLRPDQRAIAQCEFLPPIREEDRINNPLVKQALFEVRKLVNAIIREYGKPDAIHLELAREVQGGAKRRKEMIERMRERERRRAEAASFVQEYGQPPNGPNKERYLLWKDQKEHCLYSGVYILPERLFGGEVQVDHILPRSRSLDNSYTNKCVCFRDENDAKGNRTPAEWLEDTHPEKFAEILLRAGELPLEVRDGKRRKIAARSVEM